MFFTSYDNWTLVFMLIFVITQKYFVTAILLRSLKEVFWNKSLFFMSVNSTITLQCYQYQITKLKLLLLKFSQQILFLKMLIFEITLFHFEWMFLVNEIFKTQNISWGMFFLINLSLRNTHISVFPDYFTFR